MGDDTNRERIARSIEARADHLASPGAEDYVRAHGAEFTNGAIYELRAAARMARAVGIGPAARVARETIDPGWIAVADRLPPDVGGPADGADAPWMLVAEHGECWMAYYAGGRWLDDEGREWTPTHWRPQPTPPETADGPDVGPAAHGDVRADAGGGDGITWEAYNR